MKKIIVAAVAAAIVGGAYADIKMDLLVSYGISDNTGTAGIVPDVVGQDIVLQLYSVGLNGLIDYAAAPANGTLGDILGTAGDGDDILLGSGIFTVANVGAFEDYAAGASISIAAPWTSPVYARVIGAGDNGITAGDWFFQTGIFAAADITDPKALQQAVFVDNGGLGGVANMGQVIPEPATLGLMGIAGLGMFLARKKARS